MSKRLWNTYPKRFMNHLTISNPVFGLIGIAISAVGTTISAPNVLYAGFATVFLQLSSQHTVVFRLN